MELPTGRVDFTRCVLLFDLFQFYIMGRVAYWFMYVDGWRQVAI